MTGTIRLLVILAVAALGSGRVLAADLEQQARELEAMVMAPCCFSQQVSVHHSAAADEMRQDIRMRLRRGETRDQILATYVTVHGRRILARPPAEGYVALLYVLPALGLAFSGAVVFVVLRRFTHRRSADLVHAADAGPSPAEARYQAEVDEQLRDLD